LQRFHFCATVSYVLQHLFSVWLDSHRKGTETLQVFHTHSGHVSTESGIEGKLSHSRCTGRLFLGLLLSSYHMTSYKLQIEYIHVPKINWVRSRGTIFTYYILCTCYKMHNYHKKSTPFLPVLARVAVTVLKVNQ